MRRASIAAVLAIPAIVVVLSGQQNPPPAQAQQQPPAGQGTRRRPRPADARAARGRREGSHEREAALPDPIAARDSVWIEELTYLEVRDAMKAGKTTALVMAGSTEQNGPYMAGGKHQYAMKLVGEAIARKLGNALIAPIIPIEAGNPENKYLEWGSHLFHRRDLPGRRPRHRDQPEEPGLQEHRAARRQRRQHGRACGRSRRSSRRQVGRRRAHLPRARVLQLDQQGRRPRLRHQADGIPEKTVAKASTTSTASPP